MLFIEKMIVGFVKVMVLKLFIEKMIVGFVKVMVLKMLRLFAVFV